MILEVLDLASAVGRCQFNFKPAAFFVAIFDIFTQALQLRLDEGGLILLQLVGVRRAEQDQLLGNRIRQDFGPVGIAIHHSDLDELSLRDGVSADLAY